MSMLSEKIIAERMQLQKAGNTTETTETQLKFDKELSRNSVDSADRRITNTLRDHGPARIT